MDQNQQKLKFLSRIDGDFQFNKNKEEQFSNKQYIEYYNSSQNNQVVLSVKEFKRTKFIINQENELLETNYQDGKENVIEKKPCQQKQTIKLERYYEDKYINDNKSCLFCLSFLHLKKNCSKIKCPYCNKEHIKWKCKDDIKGKNKYSKTKQLLTFKNEFGYDDFPRQDLIKCLKCNKYGHVNCSQLLDHYIKLKMNFDQNVNNILEQNYFFKTYQNNERINWYQKINYDHVLIDDFENSSIENNYLNEKISKKKKKQKNKQNYNNDINDQLLANKNLQLLYQQGNELIEKQQRKIRNKDKIKKLKNIKIKKYQEDLSDLDNSDIEMINQKINEICQREIPKLLKTNKYQIKIIIEKEKKSSKVKNEKPKMSRTIRQDISQQNNFLQLQYNEQENMKNQIKFYESIKKFKYKNLHKLIRQQSAKKLTQNVFEKIHKDDKGNIYCIYSGQIIQKKQKQIYPFNKEHCLPRYFLNTPINHYDNNILILVPVIIDFNSMRANKPYYCPTEMSNDQCQCQNQILYKRRNELEVKIKKFEFGTLLENYYENTIQESSKKIFNKKLPHVHELYERNEAGHFYMGKQSFFCSNKNKGGIARICLYALLKYRKSFKKEHLENLQLDYLKYLCKKYKVEEWEKKKNYYAEKYQGDRNPFVDYPELVDTIDLTHAFIQQINKIFQNLIMSQKQQNKESPTFFDNLTNYELDFSRYDKSIYSFDQKLTKISKKSIVMLIFNTFRSFVAIGILTLPYGISKVGPLLGFFTLMFIGLLVAVTTLILMEIADDSKFKGANLEILGKLLWGNAGHKIIIGLLVMACIVSFIGGILFSVDFLDFAFCSHHIEILCHSKKVFLLVALVASILIISIESLKPFGYVSIFATFIILIGFISITSYNLTYVITSEDDLSEKLTHFDISGFFTFFGLAFYTTEGIGLLIPLRASFNDRTSFNKIFMGTYTLIMWTYTVLAILSYVVSQKEFWIRNKTYNIFQL